MNEWKIIPMPDKKGETVMAICVDPSATKSTATAMDWLRWYQSIVAVHTGDE